MTKQRLWIPVIAPVTWSCHFTFVTVAAALGCGRFSDGLTGRYTLAILVVTAVALVVMALCLAHGARLLRYDWPERSHDDDSGEDRRRFLGYMTMLLAGLSVIATLYSAIAVVMTRGCP